MIDDLAEMKHYRGLDGREIVEFVPVFDKKAKPVYRGLASVMTSGGTLPNGMPAPPRPVKFEFAFAEGTTLATASKTFGETCQKAINDMQNAQMKKVVTARAPILGPNGRPMAAKG
jgi:hypothetical protein